MTFRKGQELVCIAGPGWVAINGAPSTGPEPIKGQVYHFDRYDSEEPKCPYWQFLYLSEFEDSYEASNFRPVQRTNISIFTEILERETIPSTEKEKV